MPDATTLWDAGPIVALIDRHEEDHDVCVLALNELRGHAATTEAVITEAHYLLRHVRAAPLRLLELIEQWGIDVIAPDSQARLRQVELMTKSADAPMDYADATLVALAEQLMTPRVYTLDRRHFLMYRLYDRQSFEIIP
jgi:uncharacterized protein